MRKRLKIIILFLLAAWCLSASVPGQNAYSETEQIITNWTYPHYEDNYLVWEAKGKAAVVKEQEYIISVFELTYYLVPVSITDSAQLAHKDRLIIQAKMAKLDKKEQLISLHEDINIKRTGGTAADTDTQMQTESLRVDLTDNTFATESPVTISKTDIAVKAKGCQGKLDFESFSFLSNAEVFIRECSSKTLSLGTLFAPGTNSIESEDLNRIYSAITITCQGPLRIEKISAEGIPLPASVKLNGGQRTAQRISLNNKVKISSLTPASQVTPARATEFQAENMLILLDRRENPVTKRATTYLANITARKNVKINEDQYRAECESIVCDESTGNITLIGKDSLAGIYRPLNSPEQPDKKSPDSYIKLSGQSIKVHPEKDELIIAGRKEVVFAGNSIPNAPKRISGTEETAPPPAKATAGQIAFTADNDIYISLAENEMLMEKNVRAIQKQDKEVKMELQCDKLTIRWNPASNDMEQFRAENNIRIRTADDSWASGQILDWTPALRQISIKSLMTVQIWYKNSLLTADEIVITTKEGANIGDWSRIETKNRNGGIIKVSPQGE